MDYFQLYIPCADPQQSEIWIADLAELAFESFEQEETCLKAYINEAELNANRDNITQFIRSTGVQCELTPIETVNWNAVWESGFEPVAVGTRCMIRAPFHEAPHEDVLDIVIMPKMSFGTGHHATTYLMIDKMSEMDFSGLNGLDMGSGTGVLAIAAVKTGAAHVDAVDIDEWAYENCIENIATNGIGDKITPIIGDVSAIEAREYDFILANINRNILLADMPAYASALKPGGVIVMSGILKADIEAIRQRAEELGFLSDGEKTREGWAMVSFRKP